MDCTWPFSKNYYLATFSACTRPLSHLATVENEPDVVFVSVNLPGHAGVDLLVSESSVGPGDSHRTPELEWLETTFTSLSMPNVNNQKKKKTHK